MSDKELARLVATLDAAPGDPEAWERLVDFRSRRGQRDLGVYQVRDLLARAGDDDEDLRQAFYSLACQSGFGLGDPYQQYPGSIARIRADDETIVVAEGLGLHWVDGEGRARVLLQTRLQPEVLALRREPPALEMAAVEDGALWFARVEAGGEFPGGLVPWREVAARPEGAELLRASCIDEVGSLVLVVAEGGRVGWIPTGVDGGPLRWAQVPLEEGELHGLSVHPEGYAAVVRSEAPGGHVYDHWLVEPGRDPERLDPVPERTRTLVRWNDERVFLNWIDPDDDPPTFSDREDKYLGLVGSWHPGEPRRVRPAPGYGPDNQGRADSSRRVRLLPPPDKRRGVIPRERYPIDWIRVDPEGAFVLTASSVGVVRWSWPEGRRVGEVRGIPGESARVHGWRHGVDATGRWMLVPSARRGEGGRRLEAQELLGGPRFRLRAPSIDHYTDLPMALAPDRMEASIVFGDGRVQRLVPTTPVESWDPNEEIVLEVAASWDGPGAGLDSGGYAGPDQVWAAGRGAKRVYLLDRETLEEVASWPLEARRGWAQATHRWHPVCGLVGADEKGGVARYVPGEAGPRVVGPPDVPGKAWALCAAGRRLACACGDVVRVWDLGEPGGAGTREVAELGPFPTRTYALAFAPGGERLLVAREGHVRFFELDG